MKKFFGATVALSVLFTSTLVFAVGVSGQIAQVSCGTYGSDPATCIPTGYRTSVTGPTSCGTYGSDPATCIPTGGGTSVTGDTSGGTPVTGSTVGGTSVSTTLQNPIKYDNFTDFVSAVIKAAVEVLMPFVVLAFIYSGFLFVKAQGKDDELTKAKSAIFWSVIGAFILLGAWGFAEIIGRTVSTITS